MTQAVASYSSNICPPLVSFIITNHNYGSFLERCVDSIFAQAYPRIECIVVDDASTDNSATVIEQLCLRHASIVVISNPENYGQTRSCIEGFKRSKGQYVALIDADDFLLPGYAAAHIKAHLMMRTPIGFSSCDMLECVESDVIWASCLDGGLTDQVASVVKKKELKKLSGDAFQFLRDVESFRIRRVYDTTVMWAWGPTSSTVYRRDALNLFIGNTRVHTLQLATDAYFNFAINSLCGSIIIDKPFAVYQIHAANNFARAAHLAGIKHFENSKDYGSFAAYCALEHIVLNFAFFAEKCHNIPQLLKALATLAQKSMQSRRLIYFAERIYVGFLAIKWRARLRSLLPYRR